MLSKGAIKPYHAIHISGTHAERRLLIHPKGAGSVESRTITVTDFDVSIDLTSLVLPEPTFWCADDDAPVCRGNVEPQTEPNGPVPHNQRTFADAREAEAYELRQMRRLDTGISPWADLPENDMKDLRVSCRSRKRSSRSLKQWCHDYCRSAQRVKDFRFQQVRRLANYKIASNTGLNHPTSDYLWLGL